MSMIKTHLHKLQNDDLVELKLPLHYVEFLLSYLDEEADISEEVNEILDEIRTQTYA